MTDRFITVAEYITYAEAVELYQALEQVEILSLVKSCGPPSLPFGEGIYYQLQIKIKDHQVAEPVLRLFSENQAKNRVQVPTCPTCGSVYVEPEEKLPLWRKIIYAGTTVYKCQPYQHTFFV
ncbi:hypothetical protein [Rufibacter roseus]|uniref:DUF2007 domain-containing protein n=1 Tax=Rufibacter roseus TaxID=1567108 RepID=A0ABW2DPJ4_9BACT|nr:hypothetical protein [Rufibacter roseus]